MSSTPSPDGTTIYYTGYAVPDVDGGDGEEVGTVFAVDEAGGEPRVVSVGYSVVTDLVTSLDGLQLFISDLGAELGELSGAIVTVPAAGGNPAFVPGTAGYEARGLALVAEGESEVLYFSGRDPATGASGVFKIGTAGGDVTTVAAGEDFADPSGLVVTEGGDVYVADNVAAGRSGVLRIRGEAVERLEVPYALGYPAGLALSADGTTLFISAQNNTTRNATFVTYSVADGLVEERSNETIAANLEAGGLHRGHATTRMSWCGSGGDGLGAVYLLLGQ
jgi:hypothetical protein